jgi:hypothetical protein
LSGEPTPGKTLVSGFNPSDAIIRFEDSVEPKTPSVSDDFPAGGGAELGISQTMVHSITAQAGNIIDPNWFQMLLLQQAKDKAEAEKERARERADREERKREREEKELKEKREREEKELKEKREREEKELKEKRERDEKELKEKKLREEKDEKERKEREQFQLQLQKEKLEFEKERELRRETKEQERLKREASEKEERLMREAKEATERAILVESLKSLHQQSERRQEEQDRRKDHYNQLRSVRLQKAIDLMSGLLSNAPDNITGLLLFFKNVEQLFARFGIESDLQVSVVSKYLNDRCKKVIMRADKELSFAELKTLIFTEFNFTPALYYQAFTECFRSPSESNTQFIERLYTLYGLYLDSRNVNKSFDKLLNVIIRDRYLGSVTQDMRVFVSDRESTEQWMEPRKLGTTLDLYESGRNITRSKPFQPVNRFRNYAENRSGGAQNFSNGYKNRGGGFAEGKTTHSYLKGDRVSL